MLAMIPWDLEPLQSECAGTGHRESLELDHSARLIDGRIDLPFKVLCYRQSHKWTRFPVPFGVRDTCLPDPPFLPRNFRTIWQTQYHRFVLFPCTSSLCIGLAVVQPSNNVPSRWCVWWVFATRGSSRRRRIGAGLDDGDPSSTAAADNHRPSHKCNTHISHYSLFDTRTHTLRLYRTHILVRSIHHPPSPSPRALCPPIRQPPTPTRPPPHTTTHTHHHPYHQPQ